MVSPNVSDYVGAFVKNYHRQILQSKTNAIENKIAVLEKNQILSGIDAKQYEEQMRKLVGPDGTYESSRGALDTIAKEFKF